MFDTMTFTKIAASLCGALLIFLLGKWAAEELYHVDGHGQQAYVIETGADEVAEEVTEVSIHDVMGSADIDKGAKVFRKCSGCHKIEGAGGQGPYLLGVVGRDIGSVADYSGYSGILADMEGNWTVDALNAFLKKPDDFAPGTKMAFKGLPKVEDRADLIAYLDSLDD